MRTRWAFALTLAFCLHAAGQGTPLGSIPGERTPSFRLITNADFSKAAAIDQWGDEKKWYVVMDNKVWEFYTDMDAPSAQFSADGKHFSLLAKHDDAWYFITDDKDVRKIGTNRVRGLALSRDGRHDAMIEVTDTGDYVLIDGKPAELPKDVPTDLTIESVVFSPDGTHTAYVGIAKKRAYILQDGKLLASTDADDVSMAVFSPDSEHLRYTTQYRDGSGTTITQMVDGKAVKTFKTPQAGTDVTAIAQSGNGEHVMWAEEDKDGKRLIKDGQAIPSRNGGITFIAVSDDGKHFATSGGMRSGEVTIDGTIVREFGVPVTGLGMTANGDRLTIRAGPSDRIFLRGEQGWFDPNIHAFPERALAATMIDSSTFKVFTETARHVQINDKAVNDLNAHTIDLKDKR